MMQVKTSRVSPKAFVSYVAFRNGYEDVRAGLPAIFDAHKANSLAYEFGRQSAAYGIGKGLHLNAIPRSGKLSSDDVYYLWGLCHAVNMSFFKGRAA